MKGRGLNDADPREDSFEWGGTRPPENVPGEYKTKIELSQPIDTTIEALVEGIGESFSAALVESTYQKRDK